VASAFLLPQAPIELDLHVCWSPKPGDAVFSSGIDNDTGTVRVVGGGIWRVPDAERYFTQQRRIVDEARRRFGALKVFFDVRGWIVESPQSALQFQEVNARLYRPEDRLASLVNSSLFKQHPRTALGVGNRESFMSAHAAETWLQAYSGNS
jgi:hypothetical protein